MTEPGALPVYECQTDWNRGDICIDQVLWWQQIKLTYAAFNNPRHKLKENVSKWKFDQTVNLKQNFIFFYYSFTRCVFLCRLYESIYTNKWNGVVIFLGEHHLLLSPPGAYVLFMIKSWNASHFRRELLGFYLFAFLVGIKSHVHLHKSSAKVTFIVHYWNLETLGFSKFVIYCRLQNLRTERKLQIYLVQRPAEKKTDLREEEGVAQ
jgi:hypothetical protein